MTLTATILLLISALTHAGWNLFSKTDHPSTASFLLANIFGSSLTVPFLLYGAEQIVEIVVSVWPWLFLAGFFQALYFLGLAWAYKRGELSVVYPLARSIPSLLVTVMVFLFGTGEPTALSVLLGIFFILAGCLLIPLRSFKDFSLGRYGNVAVIAALVAAVGTTGYSLVDDHALALLRKNGNGSFHGNALLALYYIGLTGFTTVFWQGLLLMANGEERSLLQLKLAHPLSSFIKGGGIFLTYSLVLISMGYVNNVSYVVAFRQVSIPIGLVMGILILQERAYGPKVAAIVLLFSGVVLVSLN